MEKINVAELLKECPKGMELDCVMFEDVTFERVDMDIQDSIMINIAGEKRRLTKYGCWSEYPNAKCVIFPKGKTTWEGFHRPFKDGDIVTWKDRGSLVAFIYKERKDVALVRHHFALYTGSLGSLTNGEISLVENEIVFATEEEKQAFFQAIKDNGYKWNAKTNTLEKLIEPKFKVGDRITKNNSVCVPILITNVTDEFYCSNTKDSCGIFPIAEQDEWELVLNKFDITTLKPFDKVLVRGDVGQRWTIDFFGFMDNDKGFPFVCVGHYVTQCIPYEGNEHLLGKTDECGEFYKIW